MSPLDIVVIVIVSAAFVGAAVAIIYRRLKGKGGCSCGCTDCSHCAGCRGGKKKK